VRLLLFEQCTVLIQNGFNQSIFANARGANYNKRFVFKWFGVEGVEVLFRVNIYIVLKKVKLNNLQVCEEGRC